MLTKVITQVSTSPWRAQVFVARDGSKPRMVITPFEEISIYLARVPFGDRRVDTVPTSGLSRQPLEINNQGSISYPGGQCRDKETNVDPDIETQCEPPESAEPAKESQVSPVSPAPTFRRSTRNRNYPHTRAILCWGRTRVFEAERSVMY